VAPELACTLRSKEIDTALPRTEPIFLGRVASSLITTLNEIPRIYR
jgi:hypothetical protein